jgi:glycerol-3-phosphate dehydrogenase
VAEDVLAVAAESGELAQPIVEGLGDILAEAVWAIREQQATTLADVMLRRTRLALLAGRDSLQPDSEFVLRVAAAMAKELGWSEDEVARQIADYRAEAEREGVSVAALVD